MLFKQTLVAHGTFGAVQIAKTCRFYTDKYGQMVESHYSEVR